MGDPTVLSAQRAKQVGPVCTVPDGPEIAEKADNYFKAAAKTLARELRDVLERIPNPLLRNLALRGYLIYPSLGRGTIKDNWAWTSDEEKKYKESDEGKAALEGVDRVKSIFASANPGYTLGVVKKVRSLDTQIDFWNRQDKPKPPEKKGGEETEYPGFKAAKALGFQARCELSDTRKYSDPAEGGSVPPDSLRSFIRFIKRGHVTGGYKPTWATPGLSDHGQLKAFDFVVLNGRQTVVGANAGKESIAKWEKKDLDGGESWKDKLKNAVEAARKSPPNPKFSGPLQAGSLNEPWHYAYEGQES